MEGGCGDCGWGAGDSEEIDCVTDVRGEISAPVSGSGECGDSAVCLAGERAVNAGKISGEWAARYIRVFQGQDGSASQECQRPVLQQVITLIHSLIKILFGKLAGVFINLFQLIFSFQNQYVSFLKLMWQFDDSI